MSPVAPIFQLRRAFRHSPLALLVFGIAVLSSLAGCGDAEVRGKDVSIPLGAPALPDEDERAFTDREVELLRLQVTRAGRELALALEDPDPRIRARAALALASVEDPGTRGALEARLHDANATVRRNAAFALGQLPAPDGGAQLLAVLVDGETDPDVRLRIVEALGKQGGEPAAEGLLAWEPDPHAVEEVTARALALGRLLLRGVSELETAAELVGGLRSPLPGLREASAWALARLPDPGVWAPWTGDLRTALDAMGGDDPAASHLLTAVARLRDAEDLPRFTARLRDADDWRIRTTAARAIGARQWVASDEVREALRQAMTSDPSGHVRIAAAAALAELLPPPRATEMNAWIAGDPGDGDPGAGNAGAGSPGGESPGDWRTHIPFLRFMASDRRTEPVVDWIRRVRSTSPAAAVAGIEALQQMGGPGVVDLLVELAADPDPEVRAAAIRGLGGLVDGVGDAELVRLVEVIEEALFEGIWAPDASQPDGQFDRPFDGPLDGRPGDRRDQDRLPAAAAAAAALGHPVMHAAGALSLLEAAAAELEALATARGPSPHEGAKLVLDPQALLRKTVLLALGDLGDPEAIPRLEAARSDASPMIRRAAGEALERLTGVPSRGLNLPAVDRPLDPERLRVLGPAPRWILETDRGEIVVRLAPGQAPLTVQTVAELTEAGAYDDTAFHRVIGNFVAQGGDVSLRDGTGTPGFAIRSEWTQIPFVRGVVGMASAGKDTEGSQFFLTHASQPHLDGAYTAFGWVESGGDVMDRLMPGDRLLRARVAPTNGTPGPSPPPR